MSIIIPFAMMENVNPPPILPAIPLRAHTLGKHSRLNNEGYRNTIELLKEANISHLQSDIIRLVQNRCALRGLGSKDPNQHLKDFLSIVDSIYLNGASRETTRLHLFQFSLYDQASNQLDRLHAGTISTWDDFKTRFLA
ncbi:hypothetical protein Tco_0737778 [Tanacetum coccineum]